MPQLTFPTPFGDLLATEKDGALSGLSWQNDVPGSDAPPPRSVTLFDELRRQLDEYWDGRRHRFDIPLSLSGTPFQLEVWRALVAIPHGQTSSYSEVARSIGRPAAIRAMGRANGANPVAILVPCHRVIGADGALTGYAGGIERKRSLLRLEGAWPSVE
jgi:methylated-DNA-[protein]-cysteine S-methyltransferase